MSNFKKGGFQKAGGSFAGRSKFSGGKKFGKFNEKFGGGRGGSGRARERMELFDAICSKCKKNCKVPFRPTGDKPVYCRDCFSGQEQVPGRNSNGKDRVVISERGFHKDARTGREYHPGHGNAQREDGIDALKRQIAALESKVNRILELMSKKMEE